MIERSRWKADEAKKCQPGNVSSRPGGKKRYYKLILLNTEEFLRFYNH